MIREIQISAAAGDEDGYTEPPSMLLILSVIGEEASLRVHACGERGTASDKPVCDLHVPARSLLLALQAAIDDQRSDH
jgi:hypothetical protein